MWVWVWFVRSYEEHWLHDPQGRVQTLDLQRKLRRGPTRADSSSTSSVAGAQAPPPYGSVRLATAFVPQQPTSLGSKVVRPSRSHGSLSMLNATPRSSIDYDNMAPSAEHSPGSATSFDGPGDSPSGQAAALCGMWHAAGMDEDGNEATEFFILRAATATTARANNKPAAVGLVGTDIGGADDSNDLSFTFRDGGVQNGQLSLLQQYQPSRNLKRYEVPTALLPLTASCE
eukprot:COSAG05_NODE_742_length_7592_cov_2.844922_10_plen_230_part_00